MTLHKPNIYNKGNNKNDKFLKQQKISFLKKIQNLSEQILSMLQALEIILVLTVPWNRSRIRASNLIP